MTVWHTVATGAEHVKVSPDLIRAAVKDGDLQAFAIGKGKEFRLREDDIDSWLEARSWEPRGAA
jgi:excisionase family DNA binding protein